MCWGLEIVFFLPNCDPVNENGQYKRLLKGIRITNKCPYRSKTEQCNTFGPQSTANVGGRHKNHKVRMREELGWNLWHHKGPINDHGGLGSQTLVVQHSVAAVIQLWLWPMTKISTTSSTSHVNMIALSKCIKAKDRHHFLKSRNYPSVSLALPAISPLITMIDAGCWNDDSVD